MLCWNKKISWNCENFTKSIESSKNIVTICMKIFHKDRSCIKWNALFFSRLQNCGKIENLFPNRKKACFSTHLAPTNQPQSLFCLFSELPKYRLRHWNLRKPFKISHTPMPTKIPKMATTKNEVFSFFK